MTKEKEKTKAKAKAKVKAKPREDVPVPLSHVGPPRVVPPAAAHRAREKAKAKVSATTTKRELAPEAPSAHMLIPKTELSPQQPGVKKETNRARC